MAKKITQYPASGGNPDVGSLIDISELSAGIYTTKKLTIQQLLDYLTANLNIGASTQLFNNTGSTITKGTPVQIGSGVTGLIPNMKVISTSDATNDGKIFIPDSTILNGASGNCIEAGLIQFGSTFATGDKVFWNFASGTFTNISTQDDQVFIGIIIVGSPLSSGKMFVAPRFSPSLVKGTTGQIPLFLGERKINGNTHFTFVDVNGTEVGFRFSDNNNNLTQVGVTYLNVESEGIASNSVLRLANWADNANKGVVSFRKSRGSKATPTKVLAQDVLGSIIYAGQSDKSYNGGASFPSGMTTGEIIVRALNNYFKAYDPFDDITLAQGLTQYEIWLQPSNGFGSGDATPPNVKVFSVDGDGVVSFKNYSFPINVGSAGQVLTAGVGGLTSWTTPSSTAVTLPNKNIAFGNASNVLSYSGNLQFDDGRLYVGVGTATRIPLINILGMCNDNTAYPIYQFTRFLVSSGPYVFDTIIIGAISSNTRSSQPDGAIDVLRMIATESHSPSNAGQDVVLYSVPNGGVVNKEVIRLGQDGKLKVSNAYKLPLTDGSPNQLMATNGLGQISFVNNLSPITQDKWALPNSAQLRGIMYNPLVTTFQTFGGNAPTETGTKTAKTPTAGSELSKKISCKLAVSTSAVNGNCAVRGGGINYFRENGLLFSCGFAVSDTGYNPSSSMFVGLSYLSFISFSYTTPATVGSSLWNSLSFVGVGNDGYSASFTGSCTGTTLTVSAITYGTLEVGQSFSTATTGTKILSQLSGTTGGVGTYQLSISQTITNSTMRAFDLNLCIVCNDASGNATKFNLGDNFPANRLTGAVNTNNFYVFEMYSGIDANEMSWRIKNTGIANSVQEGTISTNLPALGVPMNYQLTRNSMGDSNACSVDISHLYCSNLS